MWNRKQLLVACWISLLLIVCLTVFLTPKALATDVWAYSDLLCRKQFNVTSTQGNLADYPILLYVNNGSNSDSGNSVYIVNNKTDFSDVAFALDSGTPLTFWVENYTTSVKANFWVKMPYINSTVTTGYIYYASSTSYSSDGANVFPFFDNFTTLDSSKWLFNYTLASYWSLCTVSNNQLKFTGGAANTWYSSQSAQGNLDVINYTIPTNCSILTWLDTDSSTSANMMFQSGLIICDTSKNTKITNMVYDGGAAVKANDITYYSYIGTGHNTTDVDLSGGTAIASLKMEIQKFGTSYNLSEYKANPKGYVFYKGSYSATTVDKIGVANNLYSTSGYAFAKSCSYRYFVVRPLVNPDPTPSAWGSVEVNSFLVSFEAGSILYPYPEGYAFLNCTLQKYGGTWQETVNASLDLTRNGIEIILLWVNFTNTFSVYSDTGNYCVLNATGSVRVVLNSSSLRIAWNVAFRSNMTEGNVSLSAANTKVCSALSSVSSSKANWFYFEHDHTVIARFTFSPSNPIINQSIQFNGTFSLSTKDLTSYSWSFGDGTSNTTSLEPVKSYSSENNFTVSFSITTDDGSSQFTQIVSVISSTGTVISPGGGGSLGWGAIILVLLIPSLIVVLVIIRRKR